MASYAKINVGNEGRVELHDKLALTGAEVSLNRLPAGAGVPFVHFHRNNEVIYGVLEGAGRAVIPMISMLAFWCVVRVAIITVATPIYQSIAVVNWVYPITWALSSIFLLIYYYKADWLTAPGHRSGEPVKH